MQDRQSSTSVVLGCINWKKSYQLEWLWDKAIQQNDMKKLANMLVSGFVPRLDLQTSVSIQYLGKRVHTNLIGILLRQANALDGDISLVYACIDNLLEKGAPLPELDLTYNSDYDDSDYLIDVVENVHDFYLALREDPERINFRDEGGRTLLHHIAYSSPDCAEKHILGLFYILHDVKKIDCNVQDEYGNTALHLAASNLKGEGHREYVFNKLLEVATKHAMDFSLRNHKGLTVLQLVAINAPHLCASLSKYSTINVNELSEVVVENLTHDVAEGHNDNSNAAVAQIDPDEISDSYPMTYGYDFK